MVIKTVKLVPVKNSLFTVLGLDRDWHSGKYFVNLIHQNELLDSKPFHIFRDNLVEDKIIVHGDEKSSKVVGRAIGDIKSPPGATLAALVRNGEVLIAHHDTVIQTGDHVIVFVVDKANTKAIEKLFAVSLSFF